MSTPKLLTTEQAAAYLSETHGIKRTPGTLAILRCRGGSPRYRVVGRRQIRYEAAALDEWATAVISPPLASTSEAAAPAV